MRRALEASRERVHATAHCSALFPPGVGRRRRRHHNRVAIFALNLLAGWTAVGWIIALVWALTRPPMGAKP